ncbi:hypothetical protein V2J09_017573 [Rumex salicifolius]
MGKVSPRIRVKVLLSSPTQTDTHLSLRFALVFPPTTSKDHRRPPFTGFQPLSRLSADKILVN